MSTQVIITNVSADFKAWRVQVYVNGATRFLSTFAVFRDIHPFLMIHRNHLIADDCSEIDQVVLLPYKGHDHSITLKSEEDWALAVLTYT